MKIYNKKLYKSRDNKVIAGVIGGLGEYFEVDPVLLRVLYILVSMFSGIFPGFLAYILMALIIPERPETIHEETKTV